MMEFYAKIFNGGLKGQNLDITRDDRKKIL
jgi:hypothetical protein